MAVGRMHQLRRHMALLGHPVLGDPKYTYGYAKRHPDAAIQLSAAEADQAMSPPFGVCGEHPSLSKDSAHQPRCVCFNHASCCRALASFVQLH